MDQAFGRVVSATPSTTARLTLPIMALQALPEGDSMAPRFNLPWAVNQLFQAAGWARAIRILAPQVWAPSWSAAEFRNFIAAPALSQPHLPRVPASGLRAREFPGLGAWSSPTRKRYPRYDIVQCEASVGGNMLAPTLRLGSWPELNVPSLLSALLAARTRLLIVQLNGPQDPATDRLAQNLVDGGVPGVVMVSGSKPAELIAYFTTLYANIIHNLSLTELANTNSPTVDVRLFYAVGRENVLQFVQIVDHLEERVQRLRSAGDLHVALSYRLFSLSRQMLHADQRPGIEPHIQEALNEWDRLAPSVRETDTQLHQALNWAHERMGAVLLSEAVERVDDVAAAVTQLGRTRRQLERQVADAAVRAPRVLNANFAESGGTTLLGPLQGMQPGRTYELLVDVGPRWDKAESIVEGKDAFPEEALPATGAGHPLEVVLVSEELTPNVVSARMWLPRGTGRSIPIVDGVRAERRGPVALRVTAPSFPTGTDAQTVTVRARLSVYYEQNVLQSAVVTVGLARRPDAVLETLNSVTVDFSLTGGFQEISDRFAARSLRFTAEDPVDARHPVAVNLTVNNNGATGHRIICRGRLDAAPADPVASLDPSCTASGFSPYDPQGIADQLTTARTALLNCFYTKDVTSGAIQVDGSGRPILGLDNNNGKPRAQFVRDLVNLAAVGNTLRNIAFGQVRLESPNCDSATWTRQLLATVASSSIIQVTNAGGPIQYVFPWTLIYEYVLQGAVPDRWQLCAVVMDEWSDAGVRTAPLRTSCQYRTESWHAYNVVCPYGIWGLKHVIEQPPSVSLGQDNTRDRVLIDGGLKLAIGATADPNLKAGVDDHLQRLGNIPNVRLEPATPASDWDTVVLMLQAPEIVYFLCHGELDAARNQTYLSIGLRDNLRIHRIYPDDVTEWAIIPVMPPGPDVAAWKKRNPLVFINGCHTADLSPGQVQSFVSAFTGAGASGVLGTEVSVLLPVASEVAESLMAKLAGPNPPPIGEALHQICWQLANKGNLLGLAYTLYALSDLRLVPAQP